MNELSPSHALAIVAHPDDVEYFCGGTLAKWIKKGCKVSYVVTSSGDKGSHNLQDDLEQLVKVRENEQTASARILGVEDVFFLRYADAELSFVDLNKLRGEFVRHIRRTQAEVVLTHDPQVRLTKQHPDHRLVGQLTMDSCFPISSIVQCYKEQIIAEGLKTCQPEYLLLFGTDQANYWTDITETLEQKIKSLQAHNSQQEAFHGGMENRLRWRAKNIGEAHGLQAAEEFLCVRTGPTLPNS